MAKRRGPKVTVKDNATFSMNLKGDLAVWFTTKAVLEDKSQRTLAREAITFYKKVLDAKRAREASEQDTQANAGN